MTIHGNIWSPNGFVQEYTQKNHWLSHWQQQNSGWILGSPTWGLPPMWRCSHPQPFWAFLWALARAVLAMNNVVGRADPVPHVPYVEDAAWEGLEQNDAMATRRVRHKQEWRRTGTICRMVPPSYVCWFINPMNTIVISTINHSYGSYKPT